MQRFNNIRSNIPGLSFPGRYAPAATKTDITYEPYRSRDGAFENPVESQRQSPARYARGRKPESRGSKIIRLFSCFAAIALGAGIVSMAARIVMILDSTTDTRLMWPYGMMLKAWPPGGMLAISTYLMLASGAVAVFVNGVLVLLLCIRRGDNGTMLFSSLLTIVMLALIAAALVAAIILDAIGQPNLRSWSCVNKEIERVFSENTIGFESVCFDLTTAFSASIALAALEILNLAVAVWLRIKRRQPRKLRVSFAAAPRTYNKLESFGREEDEIPMLDVERRGQMQ